MIVHVVDSQYIPQIWPKVEKWLLPATKHSAGEYTLDQLKVLLLFGQQTLFVFMRDAEIVGAATIAISRFPNKAVAYITSLGGRLIATDEAFSQLAAWCRAQGCTHIRGTAFEESARLWRQRFKAREIYRIVEIEL